MEIKMKRITRSMSKGNSEISATVQNNNISNNPHQSREKKVKKAVRFQQREQTPPPLSSVAIVSSLARDLGTMTFNSPTSQGTDYLDGKEERIKQLEAQIQAIIKQKDAIIEEKDAKIEQTEAEREEMKAKIEQTEAEREEMKAKIEQMQAEREEMDAKIEQMQAEREKMDAKIQQMQADFESKIGQTEAEKEEVKAQIQLMQAVREEMDAKIQQLQAKTKLGDIRFVFFNDAARLLRDQYEAMLMDLQFDPNEPIVITHRPSRISTEAKSNSSERQDEEEIELDTSGNSTYDREKTIKASVFHNDLLLVHAKCHTVKWELEDHQVMAMLLTKGHDRDFWETLISKWTDHLIRLQLVFNYFTRSQRIQESEINHTQYHCLLFMQCLLHEMNLSSDDLKINTTTLYKDWRGYHLSGKHDLTRSENYETKQSYEIKTTNHITANATQTKNQVMAENMLLSEGPESQKFTRGACFDLTSFSTVWLCGRTQFLEPLRTDPKSIILRLLLSLLDFTHEEMKSLVTAAAADADADADADGVKVDTVPSSKSHQTESNLPFSSRPSNQNQSGNQSQNNNQSNMPGNGNMNSTNFVCHIDFCQIERDEQELEETREVYLRECEKERILPLTSQTLESYQPPTPVKSIGSHILKIRKPFEDITNKINRTDN